MTRFNSLPANLTNSLKQRSCLKVISGLTNFDSELVAIVSRAARLGSANLLDIACDPELVEIALTQSNLPICVSAVEPKLFAPCVDAGASIVEIGNFDSFYTQGRVFSAEEVVQLALETRSLLPDIVLSVTVPHVLPLDQQADLAVNLVDLGVDIIQTEGGTSTQPSSPGVLGLIQKASPTLAATHTICSRLKENGSEVPVMCASGLSSVTIPMAISMGASAVGVGSAINRLNDELAMIAVVRSLRKSLTVFSPVFT